MHLKVRIRGGGGGSGCSFPRKAQKIFSVALQVV